MIDPDEALRRVVREVSPHPAKLVPLAEACGLQLAEPIVADRDYPPFDRSMMDGYAVAVADAGRTVDVLGEVAAGQVCSGRVREGSCYEIMTGAPCPPGTEAIVKKERTQRDAERVTLPARIELGQCITPQGTECPGGKTVLEPGQTISPLAVAVIASCGKESVRAIPRPRMAVITTGSELVPPGATPAPARIRDSNGPMVVAMARDMGLEPPAHRHADDRLEALADALNQTAGADVILLTGGVSTGNYDLVPEALENFGARTIFHRVSQKPGKPLLLARKDEQWLFGLPGNPMGVHFCFHRYVAAAIRRMEGKPACPQPLRGELTEAVRRRRKRTHFVAARAEHADSSAGGWRVRPLPGVSSADIFASCPANCYVEVPPGNEAVEAGEVLSFTWTS